MRMKDEDWDAVLAVNLTAVFRLSRACLRGMLKRRWGRIINISSVVGATGNPGQANYAASKAGVHGLTLSMAADFGADGIRVNCLLVGTLYTPIVAERLSDEGKHVMDIFDTLECAENAKRQSPASEAT